MGHQSKFKNNSVLSVVLIEVVVFTNDLCYTVWPQHKEKWDRRNVLWEDPDIFFDIREISLHVQRRIRVDVGHVFGIKTNPYLKIKYTFEIFHQPAVKL